MPFEIGTFSVTLFALPQDLPENYIDLLNANRAGCIDLVKDEPELGIPGFATFARFHDDAPGDQPVFKHTPGKRFIEILRNRGSQQNQIRIHNMRDLMNCAVFLLR